MVQQGGLRLGDGRQRHLCAPVRLLVMIYPDGQRRAQRGRRRHAHDVLPTLRRLLRHHLRALLDRTNTRMGKARPWMLWGSWAVQPCSSRSSRSPRAWGYRQVRLVLHRLHAAQRRLLHGQQHRLLLVETALITRNGGWARADGLHPLHVRLRDEPAHPERHRGRWPCSAAAPSAGQRTMAILYALLGLAVNTLS